MKPDRTRRLLASLALVFATLGVLCTATRADIAPFPRPVPARHILFFENANEFHDYVFYVASPALAAGYDAAGPVQVPDYRTIEVQAWSHGVKESRLFLYAIPRSLLADLKRVDLGWFREPKPPILRSQRLVDPEFYRPCSEGDRITTYHVSIDSGGLSATELGPNDQPREIPQLPPHQPARGSLAAFAFAASAMGLGLCALGIGLVWRRRKAAA